MLESMRKHMSWMMWGVVALITVTFLFFGIRTTDVGGRTIAKVGDDVITVDEYNRTYRNLVDNMRDLLKDKFDDSYAKTLRTQALQDLIVGRLFVQEAERIGLRVTDEELQAVIMRTPAFARNGRFDKTIYDRLLDRINMSPAAFEASQREFLLRQKLEQMIRDGVMVSEPELAAAYQRQYPKAKPGDYEKNKETFRQTYVAGKQRDALTAFLAGLQSRIPIKVDEKSLAL